MNYYIRQKSFLLHSVMRKILCSLGFHKAGAMALYRSQGMFRYGVEWGIEVQFCACCWDIMNMIFLSTNPHLEQN